MNSELLIDEPAFTASGRTRALQRALTTDRCPLIVAIHGGGFTSEYFDISGCSLIERAAARGYGVIALDRLGYGRSRAAGKDVQTLAANAEWISEAIDRLWTQFQEECAGVVLIGHSIGAALAVMLAAQPQSWPLAGVAVSGAGLTPNPALHSYFERFPADTWVETSAENKDRLMFGNPDDVKSGVAELVRPAYVPIATRELLEINTVWPQNARALLTSVEVPVQFRLAEQDGLWVVNDEEIQSLSDLLSRVTGSSAAIVSHAGHCIDFHNVGPQFQDDQLNFALGCCRIS
jgi:pimeloyl-ACP methyl ester carboxylesterase